MPTPLLIATSNPGKLRELQALLVDLQDQIQLLLPADLNLSLEVVEDGDTYLENAVKKALAYGQASGLLTLADDSGLEVDALNGAPGLFSARYSDKPGATDADRRSHLLDNLHFHPRPWTARFRCLVALASPNGDLRHSEGICPGEIIPEERGNNGFGYDPIFLLSERGKTMAELSMAEKNTLSHRARAVHAAIPLIQEMISR